MSAELWYAWGSEGGQCSRSRAMERELMLETIKTKKDKLDALRPFSPEQLANMEAWYDVELT